MAKIPQGAWNAIAARYQNGESISSIARSYGCTPPAIHYILKRNRQRPTEFAIQPPARAATPTESQLIKVNPPEPLLQPAAAEPSTSRTGGPALVRLNTPDPASNSTNKLGIMRDASGSAPPWTAPLSSAPAPRPAEDDRPAAAQPPEPTRSPAAALPGLDSQLHLRAEAAIETFRLSFDAALAEGSQPVCERLRKAAADLMKVAARTTIVLDRLNATAERSGRAHNYPRSAHSGEDFGKFG
jgi:transposase-like protein